jgi:hypothetical protein
MLLDNTVVVRTGTHVQPGACSEPQQSTTGNEVSPAPFGDIHLNVSCREAPSVVSDADQLATVVNPSSSLSLALRATLGLLGVFDGAFESWEALHASPVRAMLYFFIPISIVIASICYLQCAAAPLHRLYLAIPSLSPRAFMCGCAGAFWRYGPAIAKSPLFLMTLSFPWSSGYLALLFR